MNVVQLTLDPQKKPIDRETLDFYRKYHEFAEEERANTWLPKEDDLVTRFTFGIRGSVYGRGGLGQHTLYMNRIAERKDCAGLYLMVDLHETLHCMMHKLKVKGWAGEKTVGRGVNLIASFIVECYKENGYIALANEIQREVETWRKLR